MTTLEKSSLELEHAHLHISREKKPQAIMVKDGLLIEGLLMTSSVELNVLDANTGLPITGLVLPLAAFDEILEMIISFGRD